MMKLKNIISETLAKRIAKKVKPLLLDFLRKNIIPRLLGDIKDQNHAAKILYLIILELYTIPKELMFDLDMIKKTIRDLLASIFYDLFKKRSTWKSISKLYALELDEKLEKK